METIGVKGKQSLEFAKSFCEIIDDDKVNGNNPAEKLLKLLENQHSLQNESVKSKSKKYCVATQDKELRLQLGSLGAIPLMYWNHVILTLEAPSTTSKEISKQSENVKISPTEDEYSVIQQATAGKKSSGLVESDGTPKPRLKRKASAPNPLSMLQSSSDSQKAKKMKIRKYHS
mmetsp:Transcript_23357/g.31973  ORF Transcript_23357/g.31973 Transcript_23357/m.31973 type:complete len:174 (+) Transcript_23357:244-765(+)